MQREGSPWQGLGTVLLKELADHFDSVRMFLLALLMVLASVVPFYNGEEQLRGTVDPFPLLKLFNPGGHTLSVVTILSFLIPVMAIGLGFDSVNGEHNRRTLSRILAQPIYRDALLAGKFLAALIALSVSLVCLWLLVVGFGVLVLGVPPSGDEFARSLAFLLIAISYAGVWLGVAMLLSVLFRSPASAALLALGVWLFMTLLWPQIAPEIAGKIAPPHLRTINGLTVLDAEAMKDWFMALSRISPVFLFVEATQSILTPTTPSYGPLLDQLQQLQGTVVGATLPLRETLLMAWPQIVALVSGVIALFVATYVSFQRQEVRA
ncbi:MAG: ABC transporter permease [Bradyrhizobiaceae bacterium]|nr:ABC transporter permease [Bradyrhizobiaceae bacterium]